MFMHASKTATWASHPLFYFIFVTSHLPFHVFMFHFCLLQNPKWDPPCVEDVNMAEVDAVFKPLTEAPELTI